MAKIYERLEVGAVGMSVTGASDVIDDTLGIKQSEINENVIQGKILKNGEWVPNIADSASVEVDGETITTNADGELTVPIDGKTIKIEDSKLSVAVASPDILGGIKVANVRPLHAFQTIQGGEDTIGNRYYGVEIDKEGKAFVHVPWVHYALGTASHDILGGVMTGENTGIIVDEQVIKADFDTTDYSTIGDPTTYNYETAKVASPDTVKQIMERYNQVFLDTLGDVKTAQLNLHNAIYGTNYTDISEISDE